MNFVTVSDKKNKSKKNKLTTRFKRKKETQTKEAEKVYQRLSLSVNQIHTKKYFSQLILLLAPPQFQLSSILRSEKNVKHYR
jgi:hypothetical protein